MPYQWILKWSEIPLLSSSSLQSFKQIKQKAPEIFTFIFDSQIICKMMCESMLSTNAEIAPMHCCLGEPDCLVGIMLLFQTDWHIRCRYSHGLLFQFLFPSMHLSACITSGLCLFLISTSSHDELVVFASIFHILP